jgi:hypothetical protein
MSRGYNGLGDFRFELPEVVPSARERAERSIQVVPGEVPAAVREKFSWVLDLPYSNITLRSFPVVTPATVVRLDGPLPKRVAVYIQNTGDNGLWVGLGKMGSAVAANAGIFIAGSPIPGAHLGGIQMWPLRDYIEIYAIADVANTSVIVVECGP